MRGRTLLLGLFLVTSAVGFAACTPPDEVPAATSIAVPPPGGVPTPDPRARFQGDCPITLPNQRVPPDIEVDRATSHGAGELWMSLPLNGVLRAAGSGAVRAPWWFVRPAVGAPLDVTGERLDGTAPPLTADFDVASAASSAAIEGALWFPTPGCWRLRIASVGPVVHVVVLVTDER